MPDYWYCFFFQAEDGIRDYKVTVVQTCALPISHSSHPHKASILTHMGEYTRLMGMRRMGDRKSTCLNYSHLVISYAVFCLKKKKSKSRASRLHACTPGQGRMQPRQSSKSEGCLRRSLGLPFPTSVFFLASGSPSIPSSSPPPGSPP